MSKLNPPKKEKVSENEANKSDDEYKIIRLSVDGVEEDPDEEDISLTEEELQDYILNKIEEYKKDPEYNPVLKLKLDTLELKRKIEEKNEELQTLKKLFERLFRDREKFLRHVGSLPKIPTNDVGVGVDLPLLPESMPRLPQEYFDKASPSCSKSTARGAATSTSGSGRPIECIDLTDDTESSDESDESE